MSTPPATTCLLTLRALAERRKTRQLSTADALAAADQLRLDYTAADVKPFPNILNAHLQLCGTMAERHSDASERTGEAFAIEYSVGA